MELLRHLEHNHYQNWTRKQEFQSPTSDDYDCDPLLLNGWADRDLSLWDVTGKDGKPVLERILVALCKKKKDFDKIGYVVFPDATVTESGLSLTSSNGSTGDSKIDVSNTHYEIKGITGKHLCRLVSLVSKTIIKHGVFKRTDLDKLLWEAFNEVDSSVDKRNFTRLGPDSSMPPSGSQKTDIVSPLNIVDTPKNSITVITPSTTVDKILPSDNGTL